jgi:oligopeptidase B
MNFKLWLITICVIFAACKEKTQKMTENITPPDCKKIDTTLTMHGDNRGDAYYWLKDRENPEVIDYLNKENDYYNKMTAHTKDFQKSLFDEMKARMKEDDESVPYFYNGYWYQTKYEKGKEYPIFLRKKGSQSAKEEVLFNCNDLAKGHNYFNLGNFSVSPDNKFALFATDVVSRRIYTIKIKNLETGEILSEEIKDMEGDFEWAADSKTFFYVAKDLETLRAHQIKKHIVGRETSKDELIYEEKDDTFNMNLDKSKSEKYIFITVSSTVSSEYQYLDATKPNDKFKLFQKRQRDLEYDVDHFDGHFYVLTNKDKALNFKLMKTPEDKTVMTNWVDVIPHRDDTRLEGFEIFNQFLVLQERNNALNKIRIMTWDKSQDYYLPFDSETYTAGISTNLDFNATTLRYSYQSLKTPAQVLEFDMVNKKSKLLKQVEVPDGKFDKDNYEEKRIWATAKDGTKIPISLVYKKGIKLDGSNPVLQYAYGSYGYSMNCSFNTQRISLIDRGFVFAIAHIRGGEDMGRQWYEDGKLLKKINTFTDFIDCSKHLIAQKYTSSSHLYAMGGSAGGLLVGAVINMAPDLYNGVIAGVPFVDVVTTMLDDTIPLTTFEYDEWGNPNDKVYYDYMKSYSPYDNVKNQMYPNLYVSTGLHDSQVQYWEPAKWVAKLRDQDKNKNLIFLDTNMSAGHGGASGRFESLKEVAKEWTFLLDLENISK